MLFALLESRFQILKTSCSGHHESCIQVHTEVFLATEVCMVATDVVHPGKHVLRFPNRSSGETNLELSNILGVVFLKPHIVGYFFLTYLNLQSWEKPNKFDKH